MTEVVRNVVLRNKYGLHMRPAHRFMELANQYACSVRVRMGKREVSGKSILDLTTLGAASGTKLEILCCGKDAEDCAAALGRFIEDLPELYAEESDQ